MDTLPVCVIYVLGQLSFVMDKLLIFLLLWTFLPYHSDLVVQRVR